MLSVLWGWIFESFLRDEVLESSAYIIIESFFINGTTFFCLFIDFLLFYFVIEPEFFLTDKDFWLPYLLDRDPEFLLFYLFIEPEFRLLLPSWFYYIISSVFLIFLKILLSFLFFFKLFTLLISFYGIESGFYYINTVLNFGSCLYLFSTSLLLIFLPLSFNF